MSLLSFLKYTASVGVSKRSNLCFHWLSRTIKSLMSHWSSSFLISLRFCGFFLVVGAVVFLTYFIVFKAMLVGCMDSPCSCCRSDG